MLSPKLSLALALAAFLIFGEAPLPVTSNEEATTASPAGPPASGPVKIGPLYQCDHDVRGVVYAIHDRQIMITGFDYDAAGPSTWFNGMLKGAKAISTANKEEYVQLPSPDGSCNRLEKGKLYSNQNITLNLPRPIKDFETIGIYCFEFCNNFGHVYISQEMTFPPAPANTPEVKACVNPYGEICSVEKTKHNAIHADCPTGTGRKEDKTSNAMIPHVDKMLVGLSIGCLLKANK